MKLLLYKRCIKVRKRLFNDFGFSLIEIIVASAVSSVILLLIYTSHKTISLSIHELTGVADFYENVNLAILRINRDISCSYFNRYNKKLCFIGESNYESPSNGVLDFVTVNHKDFSIRISLNEEYRRSDVNEVGYYLKPDENIDGLYYLMRREEHHYDDEPKSGGESSLLLENVVDVKFEFKRRNDWTKRWDSRDRNRFPKAVKTTLKVRNFRGNDEEFIFITNINLKK